MAISKKPINPSSTLHPPYLQMIGEAISLLKDRTGSSQPAIAKFIENEYKSLLPPNFKKILSIQLKKFVKSEKLVKIKNSYKISSSEKVKSVSHTTKELQKKNGVEKVEKTKRLSQLKTPEALKKKLRANNGNNAARKMKRLSQIKTPKKVSTASAKRNGSKSVKSSRPAQKKART
ncbi:hypothetical protein Acr_17g0001300 [Actinidia rufa]|uniref:H15 domain-containing protein n=1 Tax=Actinidia rufa TaxID=165716 RepID=A0A7J0G198_9ERIC|nr:hypothetical protein Acr_17g0001300 [Actinidia rufa]